MSCGDGSRGGGDVLIVIAGPVEMAEYVEYALVEMTDPQQKTRTVATCPLQPAK